MNSYRSMWLMVFASAVVLAIFDRLDLLALVVPLSAVIGFGSWLSKRSNASRGR